MKKFIISILVIAITAGGVWWYFVRGNTSISGTNTTSTSSVVARGGVYTNDKYHFSVTLPDDLAHREFSTGDQDTIVFEDKKGEGVQIVVSPFDDIAILTADMVKKDVPDMKISDVQTVPVGSGHQGIAFLSDNAAFDGASREVWFVFGGHLYQISTYARLDPVLKAIFATWQFKQ